MYWWGVYSHNELRRKFISLESEEFNWKGNLNDFPFAYVVNFNKIIKKKNPLELFIWFDKFTFLSKLKFKFLVTFDYTFPPRTANK